VPRPTTSVLRAARKTSRRAQYSASTRKALIDSAIGLFVERGYTGTSLDEVVGRADLTKGALYHHYKGKQALFEAAFTQVQDAAVRSIAQRVRKQKDPWEKSMEGLRAYLEVCKDPTYRRIVMQEGPVALGFDRWREAEERSTYGIVGDIVEGIFGGYDVTDSMRDTFTQVFFGAMRSAGLHVAESDDADRTSTEVEIVIASVLTGLRQLAGSGADLLDPEGHRADAASQQAGDETGTTS
jgi:AcrR family transcriptional regulator